MADLMQLHPPCPSAPTTTIAERKQQPAETAEQVVGEDGKFHDGEEKKGALVEGMGHEIDGSDSGLEAVLYALSANVFEEVVSGAHGSSRLLRER